MPYVHAPGSGRPVFLIRDSRIQMPYAVASSASYPFKRSMQGRAVDTCDPGKGLLDRERDTEWVRQTLEGDGRAFQELVEQYQGRVFRISLGVLGNREEARDVAQESFLRVFRSLSRFRLGQNFYTWLYRIVINLSIDALRKRSQDRQVAFEDLDETMGVVCPPESEMNQQDLKGRVKAVLDLLPRKYRVVLVLRDIEELGCQEIAHIIGCTHATARWRLHKARKMFKDIWERQLRRTNSQSDPCQPGSGSYPPAFES